MFEAPTNNPHGAKFYGTAAVSNVLFQDTNGNGWLGEGCGKCYKLTGTSNTPGYSGVETTLVLKAANYCPPENPLCSGNNAHFDIAGKNKKACVWFAMCQINARQCTPCIIFRFSSIPTILTIFL